ncbi:MAG: hypothetical protein ACLVIY_05605 [Anaerobutyricum soehngenii]
MPQRQSERVKRTAKEMGYEYRGRAKKKKTGTNDTIMIMCPSLATQYYTTLIQFITQEATGTWVVYADSLYESFKRKGRILP